MLIRIRRSKGLLQQFQWLECSSFFTSNSCLYCTTRDNKCGRIRKKWLDFFFLTFIEECCVVIEKNIDKKLANRISYQTCYKGCLKGKFGRGGPNPREVQTRCDTGIPGEKSGLKYPKPIQPLLSMNQVNLSKC